MFKDIIYTQDNFVYSIIINDSDFNQLIRLKSTARINILEVFVSLYEIKNKNVAKNLALLLIYQKSKNIYKYNTDTELSLECIKTSIVLKKYYNDVIKYMSLI